MEASRRRSSIWWFWTYFVVNTFDTTLFSHVIIGIDHDREGVTATTPSWFVVQVAHEIYPSEWKVHSSEISITIMYCWYMFLMAVATDFTHVTINLVCCCLSPVLISHKRSCWKISQSLQPIWLDVEMLVPLFLKINQCCRDACQISEQSEDSKRLSKKLRQDFLCDIESAPIPVQCSANSSLIVLDK